jgi:UDP-glucose:(heptosyl)LPS alpha-1,3-glucosyltransferase
MIAAMKITILCKYFSPRGGAQTFLLGFVRELLADGHRVRVAAMEAHGGMEGAEVRLIRVPPVGRTLRDLLFARASSRFAGADDADLIFGEQKTWGADVVRPGGGVHAEYMARIADSFPPGPLRPLRVLGKRTSPKERLNLVIERTLYLRRTPRCVIANSDMVRRELLAHYPHLAGRVEVVYNGVDCERFSPELRRHRAPVRARLGLPADAPVGVFVSHDLRRKGLPAVMGALSILQRKRGAPEVYVVVVGPAAAWARRLAARLGVEGRLRFVGARDPAPYYGAADLCVLPSHYDPCANVTMEGLACGLPAVSSMQNGAYELLTPGVDGFYVREPGDTAALAGFLEWFSDRGRLERGGQAARRLALRHTFRGQYERIMQVLERVRTEKE